MPKSRDRSGLWLSLIVFVFLFIWYRNVHPFVVLTFDDWRFIAQTRPAVPLIRAWNPTRLLPEILMPACGYIAACVVYPVTGDYIGALSDVISAAAGLFVTAYVWAFFRFVRKRFASEGWVAAVLSVLYLGLHFLIMRISAFDNQYLLGGDAPNLLFFYTIPALLNGTLVMVLDLLREDRAFWSPEHRGRQAILVILCYFAICSNMYCSIILAVYATWRLLASLFGEFRRRQKKDIRSWFAQNRGYLLLLGGWLISIVIEYTGGRSQKLRGVKRDSPLVHSAGRFLLTFLHLNRLVLVLLIVLLVACAVLLWKRRAKGDAFDAAMSENLFLALFGFCTVSVYSILLASLVSPSDMGDAKVWVVISFYLLFGMCTGLAYLVRRYPRLSIALPLGVIIALSFIVAPEQRMFTDGTANDMDASVCKMIDEFMIGQVVEAEQSGLDRVTVEIPQTDGKYNVPLNTDLNTHLARALYRHGITSRMMDITLHPNPEINERFYLDEALKRR